MDLLIAGCGYVGSAVARRWRERGHGVYGFRRTPGPDLLQADLLNPASLAKLPRAELALLAQAPAGRGSNADEYRRTYLEGTRNFAAAAAALGVKKLVVISSTAVYATDDGSWVDEATAVGGHSCSQTGARAEAMLGAERAALETVPGAMVLRLAGIYGPGRSAADRIRRGAIKEFTPGEYTNRIRLEDIVAAIELLFDKGRGGETYLGADDAPATQKDFYGWLHERMTLPVPTALAGSSESSGKRCLNKKIKGLGLKLKYPNFKEGYADLIEILRDASRRSG